MHLLILLVFGFTSLGAIPVAVLGLALRYLLLKNVSPISSPRSWSSKCSYTLGALIPTALLVAVLPISYGIMILYPPNDNFLLPPAVIFSVSVNCMMFSVILLDGVARRYVESEPRVRYRADMTDATTYSGLLNRMLLLNFIVCIPLVVGFILYLM